MSETMPAPAADAEWADVPDPLRAYVIAQLAKVRAAEEARHAETIVSNHVMIEAVKKSTAAAMAELGQGEATEQALSNMAGGMSLAASAALEAKVAAIDAAIALLAGG